MTIDEYAEFKKANGVDVVKNDLVWWKKVRPFYYQPLFPILEVVPGSARPPLLSRVGGYKHIVPSACMTNSQMNYMVDYVHDYSIDKLNHNRRNKIKRALRYFSIKWVDNVEEFIHGGHIAYCSFYSRTPYTYKNKRTNKDYFIQWAKTLFRFPKIRILGAYYGDELSAVDISYLIEDVLIEASYFGKKEHLKYQVFELMVHALRERAAACANIKYIYKGTVTGVSGIDNAKLDRGCRVISKPAFYRLNPVAMCVARNIMKEQYGKLLGSLGSDGNQSGIDGNTSNHWSY